MILIGDALEQCRTLPDGAAHCCVTSPPYWGLRDYGCDGQLGLEDTPDEYVARMVAVFHEVRRVIRDDGTLWINIGDSYIGNASPGGEDSRTCESKPNAKSLVPSKRGLPPKNLVGIPWRLAFALQADGWILRSDIIWHKPNPMPESVRDRPTKGHEYVFLLAKSQRYFWDKEAVSERASSAGRIPGGNHKVDASRNDHERDMSTPVADTRNIRSVWAIVPQPFPGAHFACMPPALAERCIKAGCPEGGIVLDPFFGAGTTGLVADRLRREYIGIELNPEYAAMAKRRIEEDAPLFNRGSA